MIHILPGMGADERMYSGIWHELADCRFVRWPKYAGETCIRAIATRLVREEGIKNGDSVAGTSLGGNRRVRNREAAEIGRPRVDRKCEAEGGDQRVAEDFKSFDRI